MSCNKTSNGSFTINIEVTVKKTHHELSARAHSCIFYFGFINDDLIFRGRTEHLIHLLLRWKLLDDDHTLTLTPWPHSALDIVQICQGFKIGYPPRSSSFIFKILKVPRQIACHAYVFMKLLWLVIRLWNFIIHSIWKKSEGFKNN